jgi:carbonic anhydrase/acetyltransferase-like protein (isoleucine patch superfamily)
VTVGHQAILHGCTVGEEALIGMGARILNGAVIGAQCIVGAGALITEGKIFEPRSLIVGSPARAIKMIGEEQVAMLRLSAAHYAEKAARYAESLSLAGPPPSRG